MRKRIALQDSVQCWCDPETEDINMDPDLAEAFSKRLIHLMDGIETAWCLIANADSASWDMEETNEWREAAERWRDEFFHPLLDKYKEEQSDVPGPSEEVE